MNKLSSSSPAQRTPTLPRFAVLCAVLAISAFASTDAEAARRRSIQHRNPPFNPAFSEGGYADRTSVAQGDPISFHIATAMDPFSLRIVNLADPTNVVRLISNLRSSPQDCSGRFTQGCGWDRTVTVDVPTSWRSGYYAAYFPTSAGERHIVFVVKEDSPGSTSSIVVVSPVHSYQAYNEFGGRSLYPSNDPQRAALISYDRPYLAENGLGRYPIWEKHLVDWMTVEERRFEVITDVDLESPTALSSYDLVIIPGHSEYWTHTARTNLEQYNQNGGHIAVLGGNTMWWQIRLENQGRTIAGYKDLPYDPALEEGSPLASTHFFSHPVNWPENTLLGTSFRNGGYANRLNENTNDLKPVMQREPWTVVDGGHWIFNGTGLTDGQGFGREVAGLEVDGAVFNCNANGAVIGPDGSDGTPLHYQILATLPASTGWGTLGLLVNQSGGAVFNAATQGWVWGLTTDPTIRTITENVLDRLGTGSAQLYQPKPGTILAQDLFNCSQSFAGSGWRSAVARPAVNRDCAYEGPGGLELSGDVAMAIARSIAPVGQPRDHVELRFYIKADELQQRTAFPIPIVTLQQRTGTRVRQVALVEVDTTNGKRIRIARRSPSGAFSAGAWVTLPDGWHLVEATWRSPGTLSLSVDEGTPATLQNGDAGQTANELVIEYPVAELTSAGRVCLDAVAAGTEKPGRVAPLQ